MELITTLHSHMRHLIFLMAILSFLVALITTLRKADFAGWMRVLIKVYVWLITLQFVFGVIQLISRWSDFGDGLRLRLEHAFIMFIVLGILHYGMKFVRMASPKGPRNTTFVMAASIILIVLGISILPNGMKLLGMGS